MFEKHSFDYHVIERILELRDDATRNVILNNTNALRGTIPDAHDCGFLEEISSRMIHPVIAAYSVVMYLDPEGVRVRPLNLDDK